MSTILRFTGTAERDPRIHEWLDAQSVELGSVAREWFARMRQCGPDVREIMHDGYATVCVHDAPFAYVGVFRAHVNVGFFHGSALADPDRLLIGAGKHMRHVKLEVGRVVNRSALEALVDAAYQDIVARVHSADRNAAPTHGDSA